jgi:hypothetical protein
VAIGYARERSDAGADGESVEMDRASSAEGHAAAEFSAGETE